MTSSRDPRRDAIARFTARFGIPPVAIARAPGRVNLIGDHTDYNEGFVLPMAIDRAVWIALAPRPDRRVAVESADLQEFATFEIDGDMNDAADATRQDRVAPIPAWAEYVRGTGWALAQAGRAIQGWNGVIASDVPVGAGLSSSAALELAAVRAFLAPETPWDPAMMAMVAQRAENVWVGVQCGIMDQLAAAAGVAHAALLIDCRSLARAAVPIPSDAAVVILDTGTRRDLVASVYNTRRSECERAATTLGVRSLRDLSERTFTQSMHALDPTLQRRVRHVVTENARTLAMAGVLSVGGVSDAGRLMNDSHQSLRDDFEVSRLELDIMVAAAHAHPACHGARMTGAGFGGCAVALVDRDRAPAFVHEVGNQYTLRTGLAAAIYVSTGAEGATIEAADRR
jgi:galactokinase